MNQGEVPQAAFGLIPQTMAANSEAPQPNRARMITIEQLDYGYHVHVGCQRIAIESKEKLVANLSAYLNDPIATEKKFFDGELLK